MFIRCEKGLGDNRYFVIVRISSPLLRKSFSANFLIDTGACNTIIYWYEAKTNLIPNLSLPFLLSKNGQSNGFGWGKVNLSKISLVEMVFDSSIGKYKEFVNELSIKNNKTTDGKDPPIGDNILGINVLERFDILFRDKYAYLVKRHL